MRPGFKITLPWREWDFRTVPEDQLRYCILWEYARELPAVRELAKLPGPLATAMRAREDFPKPWQSRKVKISKDDEWTFNSKSLPQWGQAHISIYKFTGEPVTPVRHEYGFIADFENSSVEQIVKKFAVWAKDEAAKRGTRGRGKAFAEPWQQLKWLAALRLSNSGHVYVDTRDYLKEHQRKTGVDGGPDVLPIYENHKSWSEAKRKARKLLSCFPQ
jgi:hypothetical protein